MKVLGVFVLLVGIYAAVPHSVLAVDGTFDPTLQGNYSAPSFTALTSIPGVQEAANSKSLAILLNNLYKLCIGLAAVIAVLKIIQGGVTYMLGDSVTEKKEAKHHIAMAVLGLVFILSPYLVFNIIDPRILNLEVDVSGLTPPAPGGHATTGTNPSTVAPLPNVCTSQSFFSTMQTNLNTARRSSPTGPLYITVLNQTQVNCCSAVTDTDGSHCVPKTTLAGSGFGEHAATQTTYGCTCTSRGVPRADAPWKVNEVSIRFDFRNVDAPSDIKNSTPHTMRVVNTSQTFPTREACESTAGFGQAQLYTSITGGAYACPQTGGGNCPQRVSWLRNQGVSSLPSDTLSLQSRSCLQQ